MLLGPVYIYWLMKHTVSLLPEAYHLVPNCSVHIIHGPWPDWNLVDLFSLSSYSHISDF